MASELSGQPFGYLVLIAYWTVFVAELVGDKSIYTVSSLTLRFRPLIVFVSLTVVFAAKMSVAVLLGKFVMQFDSRWTDLISACAFFLSAALIWSEEKEEQPEQYSVRMGWARAAMIAFGSLFFTELGDPGQISAAALVLKSHSPWAINSPFGPNATEGRVELSISAATPRTEEVSDMTLAFLEGMTNRVYACTAELSLSEVKIGSPNRRLFVFRLPHKGLGSRG